MSKRKELKKIEKLVLIAGTIALFLFGFLLGPYVRYGEIGTNEPERENPRFIISSWAYPDEYGQGIDSITVYENSTGSWLILGGFGPTLTYNSGSNLFDWNASLGIKLRLETTLNYTLTGASSLSDGKKYLRHNVTVTLGNGTEIFSQNNFTYFNSAEYAGLYWYDYDVVLNFLPQWSTTYIVTLDYEVYHSYAVYDFDMNDHLIGGNVTGGIEQIGNYTALIDSGGDYWRGTSYADDLYFYFNITDLNYEGNVTIFYSAYSNSQGTPEYLALYLFNPYGADLLIVNDTGSTVATLNGNITIINIQDYLYLGVYTFYFYTNFKAGWTLIQATYFDIRVIETDWVLITETPLYFACSFSPQQLWALNGWYMLLGIGLVIFSGIFLAIGGRERLTLDKGYMAVIMFIVGWALIIGVVI